MNEHSEFSTSTEPAFIPKPRCAACNQKLPDPATMNPNAADIVGWETDIERARRRAPCSVAPHYRNPETVILPDVSKRYKDNSNAQLLLIAAISAAVLIFAGVFWRTF